MNDVVQTSKEIDVIRAWIQTQWERVPVTPQSQPGSYARGYDGGMMDILRGLQKTLDKLPPANETRAAPSVDAAWREFIQNTASNRSVWEAFQYAWLVRGELDPTFEQLKLQCQALWRTDVTLVCQLPKNHEGDHRCGHHTWTGEVDATAQKASEQPQCSGLCQGHSSEASLSGWLPDANCPVHGLKATLSERDPQP